MRAQANFVETTAFFLFLVVALELSGANRPVLAVAAALFILARILHGIGMDGGSKGRLRMYGMMTTSFLTIALIIWAIGLLGLQLLGS